MQKVKKAGLGQNNLKSKLFYAALVLIPSLQFLIFYVFVNINSFSLAFKVYPSGAKMEDYFDFDYGWKNFTTWFTNDQKNGDLMAAIGVSLKSYAISFCVSVPLGLFFSYYMFKRMPGAKLFRVLLFLPSIISGAVLAVIFKYVTCRALGGTDGILTDWFDKNIDLWQTHNRYGWTMFFNIFVGFGTSVLMYTNKMDSIAPEIVESAHLDGADGIKEFWFVILPQAFSIVQVFLMTGFAGIFSNQLNLHMLFPAQTGRERDLQTVGYLLWRNVNGAAGNITALPPYAALGLMITIIIVPLTFLLRWTMQKIGWKED